MLALDLGECKPAPSPPRSEDVRHADGVTGASDDVSAPPPYRPSARRRWPWLIGAVAFVVVCAAVAVLVTSGGGTASPGSTADHYYRALAKDDAPAAYRLLCTRQRQLSASSYAAEIRQIRASGTAISSWSRTSSHQREEVAVVTGHLTLVDGESTDIQVLEVSESGSWRVCGSNLGGVLPPVGRGSAGGGTGTVPT